MTKPAEESQVVGIQADGTNVYGFINVSDMEAKIDLISQRVEWLCSQVMGLMNVAASNPVFRMAMSKAQKGNANG